MRFEVKRTSSSDAQPCMGAVFTDHGQRTRVDVRTVDDPAKLLAYKGKSDWWYGKGANHRVVNGRIERDLPLHQDYWFCWAIEIETLDELSQFIRQHGACVLHPAGHSPSVSGLPVIEIYDDYRE